MKTLAFLLMLAVSGSLWGQALPKSVDNSAWFPPARDQQVIPNCTSFALVYYLKSYIWNREFDRDPTLEKNQFSHNFVWNLSIDLWHHGFPQTAFSLMRHEGAATVADFPINEQDQEIIPDFETRAKGLKYRSKALYNLRTWFAGDSTLVRNNLRALKDSLSHGKCFVTTLAVFPSFYQIDSQQGVYNYYPGTSMDSMLPKHMVTITGYNDDIKTVGGKGAFRVINSNTAIAGGHWWLDYNWFFLSGFVYDAFFLEEDFSHEPEIAVNLDLLSTVTNEDILFRNNIFVDALTTDEKGRKADYDNYLDYFDHPNFVRVSALNHNALPIDNNLVFVPQHNHDGNRQLISDLTDYVAAKDFESLKILIQDPISATYIDEKGKAIYSYSREAQAGFKEGYISFLGTNKRIYGKLVELPDTVVVCQNFYSYPAGEHMSPQVYNGIYIKQSTSRLRRFLITFDIADTVSVGTGIVDYMFSTQDNNNIILSQNYPNPASSTTTFDFTLAQNGFTTLKVLNLMGQEIETIVSRDLPGGEHQYNIDVNRLSEGIYIYVLTSNGFSRSNKFIVKR